MPTVEIMAPSAGSVAIPRIRTQQGVGRSAPQRAAPIVNLESVSRSFGSTVALDRVSLEIERGEIFGIIGRSGAGKSTLIRTINALERIDTGRIVVDGRDLSLLDEAELNDVRRNIGMIFQHFNLLSTKTVFDNVELPLKLAGRPTTERKSAVYRLLDLVGLRDKAAVYPAKLSGGQKQRVGIARALVAGPALLLSDEATSALDPETTLSILRLLKDLNGTLGVTIVLITHEMSVIREICDRVAVLDHGRIVEQGPVWQVFAQPRTELTPRLLRTVGGGSARCARRCRKPCSKHGKASRCRRVARCCASAARNSTSTPRCWRRSPNRPGRHGSYTPKSIASRGERLVP